MPLPQVLKCFPETYSANLWLIHGAINFLYMLEAGTVLFGVLHARGRIALGGPDREAKFSDLKANHNVSCTWENNLVLDPFQPRPQANMTKGPGDEVGSYWQQKV